MIKKQKPQGKTKEQEQQKKGKKPKPFINLTNDRHFKLFFSRNKAVLLSLLKTFLPLPDKKHIQNVEIISDKKTTEKEKQSTVINKSEKEASSSQTQSLILKDSALYPVSIGGKQSILDLNVQLNTGEKIDVEMHRRVGGDADLSMFY